MITLQDLKKIEREIEKLKTAREAMSIIEKQGNPKTRTLSLEDMVGKYIIDAIMSAYSDYETPLYNMLSSRAQLFECRLLEMGVDVNAKEEADNQ